MPKRIFAGIAITRIIPMIQHIVSCIVRADENQDGVVSGEEKLKAVLKSLAGVTYLFPEFENQFMGKSDLVELIDDLVHLFNKWRDEAIRLGLDQVKVRVSFGFSNIFPFVSAILSVVYRVEVGGGSGRLKKARAEKFINGLLPIFPEIYEVVIQDPDFISNAIEDVVGILNKFSK